MNHNHNDIWIPSQEDLDHFYDLHFDDLPECYWCGCKSVCLDDEGLCSDCIGQCETTVDLEKIGMTVRKNINFNGKEVITYGTVVGEPKDDYGNPGPDYIVDFENDGVQYRGLWSKDRCTVVEKQSA